MFAYCLNNPVNLSDPSGNWPSLSQIFTVIAVAAVVVAVAAVVVAAVAVSVVTFGAGTPLALAGGGMLVGALVTTAFTAMAVYETAVVVGLVAATAAVVSDAVETLHEERMQPNYTVYTLVDETGQVQYVGRTKNLPDRLAAHGNDPNRANLKPGENRPGLNYYQARGLEQMAMLHYHTINTANRMNNQINGVSPLNRMLGYYMEAARGVSDYLGNQVSNEVLYWTGH